MSLCLSVMVTNLQTVTFATIQDELSPPKKVNTPLVTLNVATLDIKSTFVV